jgi:hypothetical protein
LQLNIVSSAVLSALLGHAPLATASQNASCPEVHPPKDAAVNMSHGQYLFIHPKTLGEKYSGCQTMWNEKGRVVMVLTFHKGKLTRMQAAEDDGASKPLECVYQNEALTQGDPEECPEYEALASGFRTVGADALEVPNERDPRRK